MSVFESSNETTPDLITELEFKFMERRLEEAKKQYEANHSKVAGYVRAIIEKNVLNPQVADKFKSLVNEGLNAFVQYSTIVQMELLPNFNHYIKSHNQAASKTVKKTTSSLKPSKTDRTKKDTPSIEIVEEPTPKKLKRTLEHDEDILEISDEGIDTKLVADQVFEYLTEKNISNKEFADYIQFEVGALVRALKSQTSWDRIRNEERREIYRQMQRFLDNRYHTEFTVAKIDSLFDEFETILEAHKVPLSAFAKHILRVDVSVLDDLMTLRDRWSNVDDEVRELLIKIHQWVEDSKINGASFKHQIEIMASKKDLTVAELTFELAKTLSRAKISRGEFSSLILNCSEGTLNAFMNKPKVWTEYSGIQLVRLTAIQTWLNDKNRIKRFKEAKSIAEERGFSKLTFDYLDFKEPKYNFDEKKTLNSKQISELERAYQVNSGTPEQEIVERLSETLGMSFGAIFDWFEKRASQSD